MKFRLILALICLLLIIQTVSAENVVVNGDFETGDLTGWSHNNADDNVVVQITSDAHNGSYAAKLQGFKPQGVSSGPAARLWQTVDLTDVDEISFYYKFSKSSSDASGSLKFYIDGNKKYEGTSGGWTQVVVDVSDLTGNHTIKFEVWVAGPAPIICSATAMVDDVVAEAATEVRNVTFLFYEVVNQQYLANVTLYYSLDGENYTAVFSSGDNITVPSGTNLTIYNAHKFGFQSEYESGQPPESWTIDNDTTITVTFAPAQIEYKNVYFYFRDSGTGSLLRDVQFKADVYYEGENVLTIDGIYDYYKVVTAPNGSTIYVYKAHKEGYSSDIDEGTKSYTVTGNAEHNIYFYPTAMHGEVVFRFFDAKTDALLDSVQFSITGEDFSDSGVYDYTVSYDDTQLKVGYTYSYTASRDGYQSVSGSFTFTGGQVIKLYFKPDLTSEISDPTNNTALTFTVVDSETKEPVEGATVMVEGYSKLTNANGFTWFEVVKSATYHYTVSKSGYYSISGTINVGENQTDVTVELIPISTTATTTAGAGTGGGTTGGGEDTTQNAVDTLKANAESIVSLCILGTIIGLLRIMTMRR